MRNNLIITIGREVGSGGLEVAHKLADKLGAAFYDKEILYHASKESGLAPELFEKIDEKPAVNLMGGFLGLGTSWIGLGLGLGENATEGYLCNDNLFKIQSEVMIGLAAKGPSIFVGRCADYVLRDNPGLFSVFLTAKKEDRIERLSSRMSISPSQAAAMVENLDKKRAEYYNYYTFKKWGAANSYDLCLNTSLFGIDGAVEMILRR